MERSDKAKVGTAPIRPAAERGVQGPAAAATALADNRPAATAQHDLATAFDLSPQASAQRALNAAIDGSSYGVAQRKRLSSLFGCAGQLKDEARHAAPDTLAVAQRMPTRAQVIAGTGKAPKQDGSERYKFALTTLDLLNTYYATPIAAPGPALVQQAENLNNYLDRLNEDFRAYLNPKKGKKKHGKGRVGQFFKALLGRTGLERAAIADVVYRQEMSNGADYANTSWAQVLGDTGAGPLVWQPTSTEAAPVDISAAVPAGLAQAGAQKTTTPLTLGGYLGRFADDEKVAAAQKGLLNKYGGAFKADGPEGAADATEDPLLAARSVAMSRLDALLGGGVIARTEWALQNGALGTFMKEATGQQMTPALGAGSVALANQPTLQRLLSRLQLIDAIAGQVDRHAANYFIQMNGNGHVTGVTGIDLDMAWGTANFQVDQATKTDRYPGLTLYLDRTFALRILALSPAELQTVLGGLLSAEQIGAAMSRLDHLQTILAGLEGEGKLLADDRWTLAVETATHREQASYFATAKNLEATDSENLGPVEFAQQFHPSVDELSQFVERTMRLVRANQMTAALTALGVQGPGQAREMRKIRRRFLNSGLLGTTGSQVFNSWQAYI